jgi:hypothetical protein
MTRAGKPTSKRRASDRKARLGGAGSWGAFAEPPMGSNLKAAVDALESLAARSPLTDDVLRRALVRLLERQGMPKAPRPRWLEELIDSQLALARAAINHASLAVLVEDGPNVFAAGVGVGAFLRQYKVRPDTPLGELFIDVAAELGPAVGASEVQRLIFWSARHLRSAACQAAIATINECAELPYSNLSLDIHEFSIVAGVLDDLRCVQGMHLPPLRT